MRWVGGRLGRWVGTLWLWMRVWVDEWFAGVVSGVR